MALIRGRRSREKNTSRLQFDLPDQCCLELFVARLQRDHPGPQMKSDRASGVTLSGKPASLPRLHIEPRFIGREELATLKLCERAFDLRFKRLPLILQTLIFGMQHFERASDNLLRVLVRSGPQGFSNELLVFRLEGDRHSAHCSYCCNLQLISKPKFLPLNHALSGVEFSRRNQSLIVRVEAGHQRASSEPISSVSHNRLLARAAQYRATTATEWFSLQNVIELLKWRA